MIYFTSDLHFYHENIIRHTHRPYGTAEEMNRGLIRNWNAKISAGDTVYILGDFTMKGPALATAVLSQLRGTKHLIRGNHDKFVDHSSFDSSLFASVQDYCEVVYANTRFILFHYPIMEWNGMFRNSIHLHGHQHNHEDYNFQNLQQGIRRFDVGVDANYMSPVSVEDILTFFS